MSAANDKLPNAPSARERLRSFVGRITRLENERQELAQDIKDVYAEAKSDGFDPKALRKVVKDSMKSQTERAATRETEALVDIYRANLGLLDGTPLGEAARNKYAEDLRRAAEAARAEEAQADSDQQANDESADADPDNDAASDKAASQETAQETAQAAGQEPSQEAIQETPQEPSQDEARAQGRADHAAGKRIFDNPFLAGTPNRAAWDEGFCEADGSDGMDIPWQWRRGGGN